MPAAVPATERGGLLRTVRSVRGHVDAVPGAFWDARWDRRVVAALVALGALLRVPNLGRAYWIDEGISVGIASAPFHQIPGLLKLDGSPPLFYAVLGVWTRIFGSSPVSTHLFAMGISLAVVPVAFWAGRTLFSREAGVAAALLAATNPYLIWYGTETRMYTLLVAAGLVAVTFTVRAVRYRLLRDAVGAVLAYAVVVYTHNWGLYLVAVTAGVLFFRSWRSGDRRLARQVIGCGIGLGVLYAPWIPSLLAQVGSTGDPWAVPPAIGDLAADPATLIGGTAGIVVTPLLVYAIWRTRKERSLVDRDAAMLLGQVGVATLVVGWLISNVDPSWTVRYLGVVLGALLLAFAGSLAGSARGRAAILAAAAICAAWSIVGALIPNSNARYAKDNAGAIAAAVRPQLRPGDLVIVTQTEQLSVLSYYLPKGLTYLTPTGVVGDTRVVDWRHIVSRLRSANPCQTILPAIDNLPLGAHVLEISPLRPIGASGSAWSQAVNAQVVSIGHLLSDQTSLVPVASYRQGTSPKPYAGVTGELYSRAGGSAVCR